MKNYIIGAVSSVFDSLSGDYDPDFLNDLKHLLIEEYTKRAFEKWDGGQLGNPHSILHNVSFDVLFNSREEERSWLLNLLDRAGAGNEDYAILNCGTANLVLEQITPMMLCFREQFAGLELTAIEAQYEAESERVNFIGNSNVKANLRSYIRKLDSKGQFRVYKAVAEYVLDGLIPDMDCWRDCDKEAWELIQEGIERGPLFVGE